jgi:hypothetical protein
MKGLIDQIEESKNKKEFPPHLKLTVEKLRKIVADKFQNPNNHETGNKV